MQFHSQLIEKEKLEKSFSKWKLHRQTSPLINFEKQKRRKFSNLPKQSNRRVAEENETLSAVKCERFDCENIPKKALKLLFQFAQRTKKFAI
jgi:hypothetical protein